MATVDERTMPHPEDRGRTHWEGCYREKRHHNCAVVKVDDLRDALQSERERREELEGALRDLVEAIDPIIGDNPYDKSVFRALVLSHGGIGAWSEEEMLENEEKAGDAWFRARQALKGET